MSNEITVTNGTPTFLEMRLDAVKFRRLSKYTKEDAISNMAQIVTNACLYRGQTMDATNIEYISSKLVDELMNEPKYGARHLSFEEIGLIVKNAVLNDPANTFISVACLYHVIIEYCKGEGTMWQNKAAELLQEKRSKQLRDSVVAPMLDAHSGEFFKSHKI